MFGRLLVTSAAGLRSFSTRPARAAIGATKARAVPTNIPSVSTVSHPHSLTPHPATEYPAAEDSRVFAVISLMGKQHKVTKVSSATSFTISACDTAVSHGRMIFCLL